ncbi:MAG: hypothetical protein HY541_06240 [Deltaproteobacteria bacterium]|nr:hypothetical protein [Deltaproteobacteria bacterium]
MDRISSNMRGLVTERDWNAVDKTFPGAHCFYLRLSRKPQTFLDLLGMCQSFGNGGRKKSRRKKG